MPYIDQFSEESLLVIKKPPLAAPTIFNKQLSNSENTFLEDRFVCFAYRYQYQNGEFSAVSQFSAPAFTTSSFSFDFDTLSQRTFRIQIPRRRHDDFSKHRPLLIYIYESLFLRSHF